MKRLKTRKIFTVLLTIIILSGTFPIAQVNAANSSNVILDIPWNHINQCGHQVVSGPCQSYCWAYCRIILDKSPHTYLDYYITGVGGVAPATAGYNDRIRASTVSDMLKAIYDNINMGRPVIVGVRGSKKSNGTYRDHFVVAIGYRAGCNRDNLTTDDIIVLDPADKSITPNAGSSETYKYLKSYTVSSTNAYWTAKSGGIQVVNSTGNSGSSSNSSSNSNVSTSSSPTVKTTENGTWSVYVPANYKLLLYSSAASATSVNYCSARSASYRIVCSQKATLSNGAVRYYGAFNIDDHYWFSYGNGMTLEKEQQAKSYTVSFYANNGSPQPIASMTVAAGGIYGELPNASWKGYTFDGWYTAASGGTKVSASNHLAIESDHALYAHWTVNVPTYTVTLNANGGSVSPSTITVKEGGTYGTLPKPTWSDNNSYDFDGWYTAAEGGTRVEATYGLAVNANHTLYAHWSDIHQATLDPNGGTVSGSSSPIKVEYRDSGYFPVATRPGYTFDGWYTEKNGGEKMSSGWKRFSGGAYFYAHWIPIVQGNYTVTFDSCGGDLRGAFSIEVPAGGTYGKLPIAFGPTFGSELIGWFTAPTGGRQVLSGDTLVVNANHTLYAHYQKSIYTITFDPNGGMVARQYLEEMSRSPQEYTVGAKAGTYENLPNAAWEGHDFLGWFTAPVGGTQVAIGSNYIVQDDHTLYAHWR